MNSYLLFISMAWSNLEPETTSQDTEINSNNRRSKKKDGFDENDNGSTRSKFRSSHQKRRLSGPMVKVSIELVNGVTIEGDASVNSLIVWDKGWILISMSMGKSSILAENGLILCLKCLSKKPTKPQGNTDQCESYGRERRGFIHTRAISKGFSYHNPAASRYLYAPSSISMKKERVISQKSLLFTSGAVAVTDNVTILGGTVTLNPFLLSIVGGKYSYEYSPTLRFSVGGEAFFSTWGAFESLANVAYVGATYGDEDSNVSFNVGAGEVLGKPVFQ